MIIGDIIKAITVNLGRTTPDDLNPSNLTPAGPDIDLGLWAVNAAKRKAERIRDFWYSRTNVLLSIGAGGSPLSAAYTSGGNVTFTGTLSPDIATAFAPTGSYNGAPFYTATVSSTVYFLFFTGTAWQVRPGSFSGSNGWNRTTTSIDPSGTFTATGTATGSATATAATIAVAIKRITGVDLPISGSTIPVEFMTYDEWSDRTRKQVGRTPYSATATADQLGIGDTNPICYQLGQSLYLTPAAQFSFPVVATLGVVKFLPDYDADTDTDFLTEFAPEYLQWAAIAELNKFWRRFIPKQEGNIDDGEISAMANEALQTLLQWDADLAKNTSSPEGVDAMPPK